MVVVEYKKPKTPDNIEFKVDLQALELLSLIMARLRILERNLANNDEQINQEHLEREAKLNKLNTDLSLMYSDYKRFVDS